MIKRGLWSPELTFNDTYTNSSNWSEFDKRSKHFLLGDHFLNCLNSHNLIFWQCMCARILLTMKMFLTRTEFLLECDHPQSAIFVSLMSTWTIIIAWYYFIRLSIVGINEAEKTSKFKLHCYNCKLQRTINWVSSRRLDTVISLKPGLFQFVFKLLCWARSPKEVYRPDSVFRVFIANNHKKHSIIREPPNTWRNT